MSSTPVKWLWKTLSVQGYIKWKVGKNYDVNHSLKCSKIFYFWTPSLQYIATVLVMYAI